MKIDDKVDAVFIPDSPSRIKASDYNQIKNEIQECITLAGLTPTKDMIQLPTALQTLTEQSGAEEMAKIEAEGTEQIALVQAEGSTQIQAINSAGTAEVSAVNSAGAAQTAGVEASGTAQTEAVKTAGAAQVQQAKAWAAKTDGPVADGEYSAKKYAQDAASNAALAGDKAQKDLSNVAVKSGEETFVIRPDGTGYLDILNNRTTAGLGVGPDGTPNVRILDERHKLLSAKDVTDYIVETGASADQWYRKYKSGWVEQGGISTTGGTVTITFLSPFLDTNYTLVRSPMGNSGNGTGANVVFVCSVTSVWDKTATSFALHNATAWGFAGAHWYACGQGA